MRNCEKLIDHVRLSLYFTVFAKPIFDLEHARHNQTHTHTHMRQKITFSRTRHSLSYKSKNFAAIEKKIKDTKRALGAKQIDAITFGIGASRLGPLILDVMSKWVGKKHTKYVMKHRLARRQEDVFDFADNSLQACGGIDAVPEKKVEKKEVFLKVWVKDFYRKNWILMPILVCQSKT